MKIYMIRHGETEWNAKRWLQGTADIPLNRNGIEVARTTAEGMRDIPFDLIFTSPLLRAKKTAEIIRGDRDIPMIDEPRLQEISFGIYEGFCCSKEGYNIPDPDFVNFFVSPDKYVAPEGAESIEQLCARTTEFLLETAANPEYADKTILFSSHGAAVKGLLSSLTITDRKDFWTGGVHKNCGVSLVEVKDGKLSLVFENKIYYEEARSTNYFE